LVIRRQNNFIIITEKINLANTHVSIIPYISNKCNNTRALLKLELCKIATAIVDYDFKVSLIVSS